MHTYTYYCKKNSKQRGGLLIKSYGYILHKFLKKTRLDYSYKTIVDIYLLYEFCKQTLSVSRNFSRLNLNIYLWAYTFNCVFYFIIRLL